MDLNGPVHLLLGLPGQPSPSLPDSPWRLWLLRPDGPLDPSVAAKGLRMSPVVPRAERRLVATVMADDPGELHRAATQGGGAQDAARVLAAARMGAVDPAAAVDLTIGVLRDMADPSAPKALRRHWPDLHVLAPLAPGVPALVLLSRVGLGLLLADMHQSAGAPAEALAVLRALPSHPAVHLALAAALLGHGEHDRVLELTTDLANVDDVSALVLVARSVAARTTGDLAGALDAACAALAATDRSPGVLAAALEERAQLYAVAHHDEPAQADLAALAALSAGQGPMEVPEATPLQRSGPSAESTEQRRDRARERMRRRITGVGAPGTFGGRHHSTYVDEIATMFALGQADAAEELLLGLLDAVEDEVAECHVAFDPAFFLTLADLYHDRGRTEDLAALRDRYAAAEARAALNLEPAEPDAKEAAGAPPVLDPAVTGATALPAEPVAVEPVAVEPVTAEPVTAEPVTAEPVEPVTAVTASPTSPPDSPTPTVLVGSVPDPAPRAEVVAAPLAQRRRGPERGEAGPEATPTEVASPTRDESEDVLSVAGPAPTTEDGELPTKRPLTAVERAVRGPRVRSL